MPLRTQWKIQAACFATLALLTGVGLVLRPSWTTALLCASSVAWTMRCVVEVRRAPP